MRAGGLLVVAQHAAPLQGTRRSTGTTLTRLSMLTYVQARRTVIEQVEKARGPRATATLSVWDALGFVLAEEIKTDREYPPFNRSTRDGYAVRISEIAAGATLRCVAEIKAGDTVTQPLAPRTCVQIMTGAAVPLGADAVVMIEHTSRD